MRKKELPWIILFLLPTCAVFLLIFAIPLCMVVGGSFFNYRLMPKTFSFNGIGNYIQLFTKDRNFWIIFRNTLVWIVIHCVFHVALGSLLAFVLYKKPRGWKFVRVVYMIPNIISQSAIAMIFLNMYNPQYGVLNSILKAIGLEKTQHNWLFEMGTAFPAVTMTWFLFAGYTTTLVLAQCLSLDEGIIEAAKIDGASSLQIDRLVVFPLVKDMIRTTVIMAATYMLQLFSMIYLTSGGGPGSTTTNLPLYLYTTMKSTNYGYADTIGVVIIVVGMVTMFLINRIFHTRED